MKQKVLVYGSIINSTFISFMAPLFVVTSLQMESGSSCSPVQTATSISPSTSTHIQIFPSQSIRTTPGPNTPPKVLKEVNVFDVPLCSLFSFRIPENIFFDKEDGNTRMLRLELRQFNDQRLSKSSWIQFVESTQVVYGQLRQMDEINNGNKYISYILRAYDKNGLHAFTVVTLKLPTYDLIPYSINAQFSRFFDEKTPDMIAQLLLLREISMYVGDKDVGNILAISYQRSITAVNFSWTNCTLLKESCKSKAVEENTENFLNTVTNNVAEEFKAALNLYFKVLRVHVNYTNCNTPQPTTTMLVQPTPSSNILVSRSVAINQPPRINRPIPPIKVKLCGSFSYLLPDDTFTDEDGKTKDLIIKFFDIYGNEVNNSIESCKMFEYQIPFNTCFDKEAFKNFLYPEIDLVQGYVTTDRTCTLTTKPPTSTNATTDTTTRWTQAQTIDTFVVPSSIVTKEHNRIRKKYGVPDLKAGFGLSMKAMRCAKFLVMEDLTGVGHPCHPAEGENIFTGKFGFKMSDTSDLMISAMDNWEREVDFTPKNWYINTKDRKKPIGHFTQLVWRSTIAVGCGIATKKSFTSLVCRYSPKGNKFNGAEILVDITRVTKSCKKDPRFCNLKLFTCDFLSVKKACPNKCELC